MRHLLLSILALMLCCGVSAQQTVDDFYQYKIDEHRHIDETILSDTLLFYRARHHNYDKYASMTDYRFSFVDFSRRGVEFFHRAVTLNGIEVRSSNISILRRLALSEYNYGGVTTQHSAIGGYAGADEFSSIDGLAVDGGNVGIFFSGRGYLGGVRATVHQALRRGWGFSLHSSVRGGDDLYVDGVYQHSADVALHLSHTSSSDSRFSIVALSTIGERGLRYGSTDEAFTLTRNNLYNPSWGFQAGKERNSRLRSDCMPFVTLTYSADIGASTRMTLTAGADYGWRNYSSLGWYDASTPRPDNYRYMPSFYADEDVAAAVAQEWRGNNANYTQVNWDELYQRNRNSFRGAIYSLEDRVERLAKTQFVAAFQTDVTSSMTLRYALRGDYTSSRNYKLMRDLLGAAYLADIDYYLLDDVTFSHKTDNDMQHPDRLVAEGDRFGYDYALLSSALTVEAGIRYSFGSWLLSADISFGHQRTHRKGYFEKELYAGRKSLGRSDDVTLSPYAVRAVASLVATPYSRFEFGIMHSAVAPESDNMFLNPQYNNRIADNLELQQHLSAELNYILTTPVVELAASAYAISVNRERRLYRAYDDLSATYCDVDIAGLGTLRYGIESCAEVNLTRNLTAQATFAVGRYIYNHNPTVTLYADNDNELISSRSVSYMGDCYIGGAPQLAASVGLEYLTYRGWAISCSAQVAAMRYVEPSALRRTERVAHQASASEEIYNSFIHQRRLNDAITVDASLSRWFNLGRHRLSLTLSARNLLGRRDIVYGGYESSRIRHYKSGARHIYSPQDDILTYAYPRTFYGVMSWKF